ncbi:MAG: T9SS type A sorting domain-containing protein [Cytophaga sp.]|uniref:T9SS type A sorting domain-containing protein n=1 Tax=Cytophaga sp. TaxID=29535 RepID=UPI003F8209F0
MNYKKLLHAGHNYLLRISFVIAALLFFSNVSEATHFRYGSISWQHVSGNTYQITVSQAWRKSFFPNVVPGGIVQTGTMTLGDGTSVSVNLRVTTIDPVEDWFYGVYIFNKTYPATPAIKNYDVIFTGCCRISTLLNAHDQTYRSFTTVNVGTQNNNSPVSAMDPIKTVQQNTFDSFQVPFFDSDADTLTYRLATAADMGDVNFTIPAGVTINPATGVVSFNTNGYPLGAQFALGVIASDGHTSVLVDFIVSIVQQSTPPKFDYAVTPLNTQMIQVAPGQPLHFNVKALDTDIGSTVTLSAVGLPIGSSLLPNLPMTGNPVTTAFSWTPAAAQLGTYVVNFTAKDNLNVQTSTSVTIVVSLKPVFDVPPTPAYGIELATTPGTAFQFAVQASDLDHADTVRITNVLNKPATATLTPLPSIAANPTTANFSWTPVVSDWGEREIQFEATDTYNEKAYHKIGLIVNTPPVFTSTPVTSVVVNHPYSYTITGLDPDLPYGDSLEVISSSTPSWLTFTDNGDGTGTLTGTPGLADIGTHTVTLYLEDIYHHAVTNGVPSQVFTITVVPCTIVKDSSFVKNVNCYGLANGSAQVTFKGGFGPFTYAWSNGSTDSILTNVAAGLYSVLITDAYHCSISDSVYIAQPADFIADSVSVSDYNGYGVSCYGSSNGSATVYAHGGVAPYRTLWSTGDSTATVSGLTAGDLAVFVTDAHGCRDSVFVMLNEPTLLSTDSILVSNVSCNGFANGSATIHIHGGVPAYRTLWSTGDTTTTVSGLPAGTYVAFITDRNGCTDSVAVTITQPSVLSADSVLISNVSCHGSSNGSATIHIHGGVPAYRTLWSTGDTTTTVSGLPAGTYVAFITDRNGCTDSVAVTITQPAELVSTIGGLSNYSGFNVSCHGGNNGFAKATVTGGTAPYTYHWSNGSNIAQANNLSAATYFVIATDVNGCIDSAFVSLTEPAAFTATITSPKVLGAYNTSCSTDGDGSCTVVPVGGTAPFKILWNTSATTATITNLIADTYSVVLTDKNGCIANKSITLSRPENCNCVTTPPVPAVSCSTCTKVLDGQSNSVINTGDNACIVNAFAGSVSMNGGNLIICGNAVLQWLTIPNNSKVTVLGTLTVSGINFNGTNAILENFGTITVNSNLNAAGKITNNKTLIVKQGVNLNAGSSLVNNGVFTIAADLANNGSFVNNGSLGVGNTVYNNASSSMLNNCTTKARSYFVNSNVVFANNGTLDVTNDIRFNSAIGTVAGGSILRSHDVYLNSTTLTGSTASCALISSASYTQINQTTLSGKISLCDANGYEVKNSLSLLSGANSSCTTCAYTGSANPSLRDAADIDNSSVQTVSGLSVYPNPVSKGMTITLENAFDVAAVSIIDNTGRELLSAVTSEINITNLSTGIYIVKVQDVLGNTTLTKLVVE